MGLKGVIDSDIPARALSTTIDPEFEDAHVAFDALSKLRQKASFLVKQK